MQGTVVECPICGTKMTIPPGYEHAAARCRNCHSALTPGVGLADGMLGLSPVGPHPAPVAAVHPGIHGADITAASRRAVWWGCPGAITAAVAGARIAFVFSGGMDDTGKRAVILGCAEFGLLFGFLLGSTWGMVKTLDLSYAMGAAVAAPAGLILATIHHLVEVSLVAASDYPFYMSGVMGMVGGAFVGVVAVWFKEYHANAG
ncbi:MAG: hypothetical protein IT364_22105 [Candidatus Hydrogenedentes bacterium]|nr:hypothetical protein [Candidatus Hydrogenedentota bacterium]